METDAGFPTKYPSKEIGGKEIEDKEIGVEEEEEEIIIELFLIFDYVVKLNLDYPKLEFSIYRIMNIQISLGCVC